ncbi:MAG TPA: hypothetical protein VJT72_01345 [Pseudonocardiaceae bacterium]|nr:hypothetical protein [Pseudonocardiaceae bacterium]
MSDLTGKNAAERIKNFRNRVEMNRPVFGWLVGAVRNESSSASKTARSRYWHIQTSFSIAEVPAFRRRADVYMEGIRVAEHHA